MPPTAVTPDKLDGQQYGINQPEPANQQQYCCFSWLRWLIVDCWPSRGQGAWQVTTVDEWSYPCYESMNEPSLIEEGVHSLLQH